MGEQTALAHREFEREPANGQALEAFSGGNIYGHLENGFARALALRLTARRDCFCCFSKLSFGQTGRLYSTNVRFTARREL